MRFPATQDCLKNLQKDADVTAHRIGEWEFDAESGELTRGRDRRRLEPRAAKALVLLCEAQGGLVSQEKLIAEVWDGRALSENSVPVVISQLRRVLGDDARKPILIETVPKRGYRLVGAGNRPAFANPVRAALIALLAAVALASLAFVFMFMKAVYVSLPLGVGPFAEVSYLLMKLLAIR